MQSFAYDPRVLGQEVEVVVAQGGVRLLGTVDNLQAKRAAAQDAHNTVGVRAVSNELEVVPEPISDEALEHQVTSALEGAGLLEDNAISVDVEDGKVELSGNLENTPDYWHAEELARSARGAVAVGNNLSVNGEARIRTAYAYGFYPDMFYGLPGEAVEPLPTDRQIHSDVESEFFWSPFVDEDTISVGVDDGIVTLTGTVDSNREKQIAADNALEGGALRVDNEIEVRGN